MGSDLKIGAIPAKLPLAFVVYLVGILSLMLISNFAPFIPDYDGLDYFTQAERIRTWLLDENDGWLKVSHSGFSVKVWPITNGPSVMLSALFMRIVGPNYIPACIGIGYLAAFCYYMTRIRPTWYVALLVTLLCSNSFFFRLFTTLTSEFPVGLWIICFLATLNTESRRANWWLPAVVVAGLLLRSINLVFVVGMLIAYALSQLFIRKNPSAIRQPLRDIGWTLLATAPFLYDHYYVALDYMRNVSFGATAQAWKSVGGVSGSTGVPAKYLEYLVAYNPVVLGLFAGAVLVSFILPTNDRRRVAQTIFLSAAITVPLFMAQSLNIQIVFWVFCAMVFAIVELLFNVRSISTEAVPFTRPWMLACTTFSLALLVVALVVSWRWEVRYLSSLADMSRITRQIMDPVHAAPDVKYVSFNFRGVGPLDTWGLNFESRHGLEYRGVDDIYTKGLPPITYLQMDQSVNLFIAAHRNYFFAPHFGINDQIEATHEMMKQEGPKLGFFKVETVSDGGRDFDLWYRPGVVAYPEFRAHRDYWIRHDMPIAVGDADLCRGGRVAGEITFDLELPNVPTAPAYAPPFVVKLLGEDQQPAAESVSIQAYGRTKAKFKLTNAKCGSYLLSIAQSFSTQQDPRALSALYHGVTGALRLDGTTRSAP